MDTQPPADESAGTSTAPGAPPPGSGFFGAVRRLDVQRADDRWIGGVCVGLANRTGLDPLVWRAIFAASVLLGGLGLIVYGVAWALLPERRDGRIHLEELLAGRFDVAVLGALALTVIGLGRGGTMFSLWFWGGEPGWVGGFFDWIAGLLWLGFIAAVIAAIVVAVHRRGPRQPPVPGPYGPYPPRPAGSGGPAAYPTGTAPYPTGPAPYATGTTPYPSGATGPAPYSSAPAPYATRPPGAAPYAAAGASASTAHQGRPNPTAGYASATMQPRPTKPPKQHTPGPGVAAVGIVVALSLIVLAVLLAADRSGDFTGPVALTAAGSAVLLAGIGIVVSGLRGRSSGFLGFLAIMGILVALPLGAVHSAPTGWHSAGMHRFAGDVDLTVTSRSEAADGFALGFGDVNLDLTDVPMTADELEVPVSLGAGNLTVVVPKDAAVTADVQLRAGQMTWDVDDTTQRADGVSTDTRTFTDDASQRGSAQLDLQISVGAGNVTVIREDS